jgi:hypothetical protein
MDLGDIGGSDLPVPPAVRPHSFVFVALSDPSYRSVGWKGVDPFIHFSPILIQSTSIGRICRTFGVSRCFGSRNALEEP